MVGKLYEFICKLLKYFSNVEVVESIFGIVDIFDDILEEVKYDKEGNCYIEREIDVKWGVVYEKEVLGSFVKV